MVDSEHAAGGRLSLSRRTLLRGAAMGGALGLGSAPALSSATGPGYAADPAGSDRSTQVVARLSSPDSATVRGSSGFLEGRKRVAAAAREPLVAYAEGRTDVTVKRSFWLVDAVVLDVGPGALGALQRVEGVEWVHENRTFRIPEPAGRGDRGGALAHGETTYGLDQVRAPAVWDEFDTRGEGASVAVIDTGVDPDHPDIAIDDANFAEFDAEGNEIEDAEPRDTSFHGTHVSGTAVGGDASGRHVGVAPDATLYHGLGLPSGGGTFAQIIGALEWAVGNGVDVANLSLGAPGFVPQMIEPVANAVAAGTVVVASAGNDGEGSASTPGAVFEATPVGAANEAREIAEFSSGRVVGTGTDWGLDAPDRWPEEYVVPAVAGPGVGVVSAFPEDAATPPGGEPIDEQWLELSGTSMAAPHVAGAVALMTAASEDVAQSYDPEQVATALRTTAEKPEDAPEQRDTRYGDGIVDALEATRRVAADSGVEGVVTDEADDPIPAAEVSLGGFPAETDADGAYRLRAGPGSYEVTADGFGYAGKRRETTVEAGSFTAERFELADALGVGLLAGQPAGIESGGGFEVRFQVANVSSYEVTVEREFEGEPTFLLDGQEIAPGEPVAVDESRAELTLAVEPGPEGRGLLALGHAFGGLDDTVERSTGPTAVFEEFVDVRVVDRENGAFGGDVAGLLADSLDPIYEVTQATPTEALEAAEADAADGFVVQSLGDDPELIESFTEETALPQTGVVYLQQVGGTGDIAADGLASDGIYQLSETTGDPRAVFDAAFQGRNPSISYDLVVEEHPIVEDAGVTEPVVLYRPFPIEFIGGFHSYFEGYSGEIAARTVAELSTGVGTNPGSGLAVDNLSRTVLAASLGLSQFVGRRVFESDAVDLLASAARFAADAPQVTVLSDQADRIDPGGTAELALSVENLLEYELSLAEESTLPESALSVTLGGEEIDFGEPLTVGGFTGELTLRVAVSGGSGERFALDHRFVTRDRRGERATVEARTGPTAVYSPPLTVPGDLASINDAVDVVLPGGEVVVADGVYEEAAPGAEDTAVGLSVDTPDVTLRAAEGASPSVLHAEDLPGPRIVNVSADGVTIDGIDANVVDGAVDEKNTIGSAVRIDENTSGVTVRDLTAGGTFGVQIEGNTEGVTVENVTAVQTVIGVGTDSGSSGIVSDATITGVTVTDRPDLVFRGGVVVDTAASGVTVTDCEIEMREGEVGIGLLGPLGGGEPCRVADNEVVGDGITEPGDGPSNAGIYVDEIETVVENNVVERTYTGVQISDLGFGEEPIQVRDNDLRVEGIGYRQLGDYVTVENNRIAAEVGLRLGEDPDASFPAQIAADAVLARHNDLSETALPMAGVPDDGFDAPEGPFDCRRNFVGERSYDDTIAQGNVVYDPFLTDPPPVGADPTAIGTDCLLDAGQTFGLGVPGPTELTIWEVLGADGPSSFAGDVEVWDADAEAFQPVTDGDDAEIGTLDGFRVTPEEGVRARVDFQYEGYDPPVRLGGELGGTQVSEGRNVVCAPVYGGDGVFDDGSAEVELVESGELLAPRAQLGPDEGPAPGEGETRSAFTAYILAVASAGRIESSLDAFNPTMGELHEALGLDPAIHQDPGTPPSDAAGLRAPTLEAALRAVDDDRAVDAAVAVLGHRLLAALAQDEDLAPAEALEDVLEDAAGEADRAVIEAAAARILSQVFAIDVVEPGAPDERSSADVRLAAEASDERSVARALGSLLGD